MLGSWTKFWNLTNTKIKSQETFVVFFSLSMIPAEKQTSLRVRMDGNYIDGDISCGWLTVSRPGAVAHSCPNIDSIKLLCQSLRMKQWVEHSTAPSGPQLISDQHSKLLSVILRFPEGTSNEACGQPISRVKIKATEEQWRHQLTYASCSFLVGRKLKSRAVDRDPVKLLSSTCGGTHHEKAFSSLQQQNGRCTPDSLFTRNQRIRCHNWSGQQRSDKGNDCLTVGQWRLFLGISLHCRVFVACHCSEGKS